MSFNILADGLAQNGDFVNAPPEVLAWEYRLPRIIEEVAEGRCDLVCLQEANHYDEIAAALGQQGLVGTFLPKRPSPTERFGAPPDGCALFYRASRLSPASPDGAPRGTPYAQPGGGGPMTQGFVAATLRDRESGRLVVVAATHLKAKDGGPNDETRRAQAQQLLDHVAQARDAAATGGGGGGGPAVLVMGDFNATRGSPACQVMERHPTLQLQSVWDVPWAADLGKLGSSGGSSGQHGNGTVVCTGPGSGADGCIRDGQQQHHHHNCQQQPQEQPQQQQQQEHEHEQQREEAVEEQEFSTWKFRPNGEARRIIDHLYFSPQQLAPMARWRMLRAAEIGAGGLPCAAYPSDHMALMTQLEWLT